MQALRSPLSRTRLQGMAGLVAGTLLAALVAEELAALMLLEEAEEIPSELLLSAKATELREHRSDPARRRWKMFFMSKRKEYRQHSSIFRRDQLLSCAN